MITIIDVELRLRSRFVWFRFATVSFGFVSQRFRLVSFLNGFVLQSTVSRSQQGGLHVSCLPLYHYKHNGRQMRLSKGNYFMSLRS